MQNKKNSAGEAEKGLIYDPPASPLVLVDFKEKYNFAFTSGKLSDVT
jgi:hypothetical protein